MSVGHKVTRNQHRGWKYHERGPNRDKQPVGICSPDLFWWLWEISASLKLKDSCSLNSNRAAYWTNDSAQSLELKGDHPKEDDCGWASHCEGRIATIELLDSGSQVRLLSDMFNTSSQWAHAPAKDPSTSYEELGMKCGEEWNEAAKLWYHGNHR